ncbi:MAG: hypothetical protein IJU79_02305 [Desulfovibrionaceae bacterium]|nr:hypothetical protein [Desulfovibrionaceae bacterium]
MAKCDWGAVRAEYETGASQSALSTKYKISRTAIQKHIKAEGWLQGDINAAVNKLAEAKVAGVVAGCNPEKKAAAMQAAAEAKAAVIQRHKFEWEQHQHLVDSAIADDDFTRAKLAKITAETIKIRQEGERKAWGLDKVDTTQIDAKIEIVWQE